MRKDKIIEIGVINKEWKDWFDDGWSKKDLNSGWN